MNNQKIAIQIHDYLTDLGLIFSDEYNQELLVTAFTHKSYAADFSEAIPYNERLEFLGDSVLGSWVAQQLYKDFPTVPESQLTLSKIYLVKEPTLAKAARAIELGSYVRLGHGEKKAGGADKDAILADTFEAVVGYLSIDLGREQVDRFLMTHLYALHDDLGKTFGKSAKSRIQEHVQKKHHKVPVYEEKQLAEQGERAYQSTIYIQGQQVAIGYGQSKKKAQEDAARQAIQQLEI